MKHDEIITDAATPSPERIVTHWRRFQSRLWRMAEGDIYKAYSASSFPKAAAFTHEGHLYTNGGHAFSKWFHSEVNCYPLVRADEYCGATDVPFSYEGDEVTYRGKVFRLGAKVIFVASDPKVEEWRHLIRVLFSDGGMFAADCTYAEFLGDRFDPQSGNGRAARLKELAECGARPMPRTQEEMRRLLDGETVSEKLQQIDFAL
jgi:hypothetical protein